MSDFSLYPDAEIVYYIILKYSHSCRAVCVYLYLAIMFLTFTFLSLNGACILFNIAFVIHFWKRLRNVCSNKIKY